jgi:3',5'-cyclic AMP phosphodiesterase CpdA
MILIHLSDIHIWRYTWHPAYWAGKRAVGMLALLRGRARRFRLERLEDVVGRVQVLRPDHLLITGDLTTTALPAEFEDARRRLAPLLGDPARATILPGNHDRYTRAALRSRAFESAFGAFQPEPSWPWLRRLDAETAILGLDPTRPHLTATGKLPAAQLERARELLADPARRPRRTIVACHYPVSAPPAFRGELARKRLVNAGRLKGWLATLGRHLYCCGHVHAAWAFRPADLPDQLCLNAGAPLMRSRSPARRPGFLEIRLEGDGVDVFHHQWSEAGWAVQPLWTDPAFFAASLAPDPGAQR